MLVGKLKMDATASMCKLKKTGTTQGSQEPRIRFLRRFKSDLLDLMLFFT